jgi:hypothetical protein
MFYGRYALFAADTPFRLYLTTGEPAPAGEEGCRVLHPSFKYGVSYNTLIVADGGFSVPYKHYDACENKYDRPEFKVVLCPGLASEKQQTADTQ